MSAVFTKTHEWAHVEGGIATIGISEHAQEELGDIVFIELPGTGDTLIQGERFGTIESTKAASELFAPLNGEVIEVNGTVADSPQLINEDPLGKGWLVKIKVSDPSQLDSLMDESAYKEFIKS